MRRITVIERSTDLVPHQGRLRLRLIQEAIGEISGAEPALSDIVGNKDGLNAMPQSSAPTDAEIQRARDRIEACTTNTITLIASERGLSACRSELAQLPDNCVFIGGINIVTPDPAASDTRRDAVLVASQKAGHELHKCSLSAEDMQRGIQPADELCVFLPDDDQPEGLRWAVLNCHEYTHANIVAQLLARRIELLVVVTTNMATRLYWELAKSDVHRLFCYVAIVNIAELGGSGLFAPFRRIGKHKAARMSAGGQLFGAQGQGRVDVSLELEIDKLRELRRNYASDGFAAVSPHGEPIVPSEHFMSTFDRRSGAPAVTAVDDIDHAFGAGSIRVAVAQLAEIDMVAYYETQYRIRRHRLVENFVGHVRDQLVTLESRCRRLGPAPSKSLLDVLLLPEVFIPRTFVPELQALSERLGCAIITGVDYPGEGEAQNANECFIIRPHREVTKYRKITRSQYDAKFGDGEGRMLLRRGDRLVRFTDRDGTGFGVLICYDFSHFDLLERINLERRVQPLDAIFVIAHNPFSQLYRSCCIADSHRFYQYVVMCNVSKFGGSGVFGPIRTRGPRQTLAEMGVGAEGILIAELDFASLREARAQSAPGYQRLPGIFQARTRNNHE